ncbi:hypothetical protein EW026_g8271 [Hermanssonia centrifuga]|uniref:NADH:flavin oxidoreductase/NADH oxidase N-terminal domain-containing protein n=1 Tax=Hermanssonia centrifuga TaxID=98765 RepID=A0A4S4K6G8_9APHY|nr:hypothetical protein EW026_g8271 [Hermanssonia centrifuga]
MASSTAPHLSSTMSLGNLTLRNRNIMSSLTRSRSFPDAVPNEYNVEYYTQRAKGGAGLILTEGTLVSQQGTEWPGACSNQRTDEWGGSPENRSKFGIEVTKALIDVWGPAQVGGKVNPCGGLRDMGMSYSDTIMTYTYFLTQISALKVAYITLIRHVHFLDPLIPGETELKRGTPHQVLALYGPVVKPLPHVLKAHSEEAYRGLAMPSSELGYLNPTPTRLSVNGGLTPREADQLIADGMIDGAVFESLWLVNPDYQKRLEKGMDIDGKGINQVLDFKTFYGVPGVDPRVGYTDYPTAT